MKANFEQKWKKASRRKKKKILLSVWSAIIHARDEVCKYCGKAKNTDAHHIYTKQSDCVAFDLENGILLCKGHHVFNSDLSAHKTPRAFFRWLEKVNGQLWVDALEKKSSGYCKLDYDNVLKGLLVECEKYHIDVEQLKF